MSTLAKRLTAALVGAAALGALAPARAQQPAPDFRTWYNQKQAQNAVTPDTMAPPPPSMPAPGFSSAPSPSPVVVTNPYAVQYNGPAGGYLSGGADVINAQGQFMINTQQAYLEQQKVKQSKLDTKRKGFDEWQYERANTTSLEDEREFSRVQFAQCSLRNPPVTEIWSGAALNAILQDIQVRRVQGPPVPIAPGVLGQINFTSGATGSAGSIGLFKNGGKLDWPPALQDPPFTAPCQEIGKLTQTVYAQAQGGGLDSPTIRRLGKAVDGLERDLRGQVAKVEPNEYIAAKRYLHELQGGVKQLYDPNVLNNFNGKWQFQAATVGQLVNEMTAQGVKFAPAVSGQEPAYQSMHWSLATFDTPVNQMQTQQGSRGDAR